MAKIVNGNSPSLGFTEFDILEKYRSELIHSVFPFECMAKAAGLSDRRLGVQGTDSVLPKDRPYGPSRILRQGNWWNI